MMKIIIIIIIIKLLSNHPISPFFKLIISPPFLDFERYHNSINHKPD